MHTLHSGGSLHLDGVETVEGSELIVGEHERTDGSVRANEGTLVTLDTVLRIPNGNECLHTTLLVGGCTVLPRTIDGVVLHEVADLQQVAGLSVDRTNEFLHECGSLVSLLGIVGQVSPCGINHQLLVLVTTVDGSIVHVHNVLTLLAVRLHDELLHLLNGELHGNHTRDAEECRLQDGVRAVAETNLLSNLRSVDGVDGDVVLSEIALHLVRHEVHELLAFEDGVQQERTILLQTTCHIIHVQVSLNVASHEVRCGHQIGRADGRVAKTQVRAGEATRLLRVVREVSLAILVGGVADDLHRVLVGTNGTIGTKTVELSLEHTLATECHLFNLRQRGERHVVDDTHGEVVLRLGKSKVVEHGDDLGGRGVA